ncbi:ribosomal protein L7/L12 [Streptomyces wuyuanensis]|uniref:ribosomal protein L7/L12 n=1 Tax=Streptomyces wuyuanensis TaxID=1196353 RepID=UPI00342C410A
MTDEDHFWLVCDDVPHEVVLTDAGLRVLDVVRAVRRLTGLSLWRGKALATRVPAVVLAAVPRDIAEAAAAALRDAGGKAEARERPERGGAGA